MNYHALCILISAYSAERIAAEKVEEVLWERVDRFKTIPLPLLSDEAFIESVWVDIHLEDHGIETESYTHPDGYGAFVEAFSLNLSRVYPDMDFDAVSALRKAFFEELVQLGCIAIPATQQFEEEKDNILLALPKHIPMFPEKNNHNLVLTFPEQIGLFVTYIYEKGFATAEEIKAAFGEAIHGTLESNFEVFGEKVRSVIGHVGIGRIDANLLPPNQEADLHKA